MGTISQKIEYLNETKQRQKTLINALGGNITNDTPFREYEKELVGVLPKVTGEGTNISLSPTIEYDLEVGSYKGDSYQATSILPSEYQQVEYIESSGTQFINTGITNIQNCEIELVAQLTEVASAFGTMLGGSVSGINFKVVLGYTSEAKFYTQPSSGYTLSSVTADTSKHTLIYKSGTNSIEIKVDGTTNSGSYEANTDTTLPIYLCCRNLDNTSPSNFVKQKVYSLIVRRNNQIEKQFIPCYRIADTEIGLYDIIGNQFYTNEGTGTFTKGSNVSIPNPNYPQDIQVVTGEQEIEVIGKNIYDNTNDTTGKAINSTGNIVDLPTFKISDYISVNSSTQYTLSFISTYASQTIRLHYYDKDKNWLSQSNVVTGSTIGVQATLTGTTPNNCKYVRISIYKDYLNIQLEVGSTATSYSPYTSQSYTLHLGDEELAKIGTYQDYIYYNNGKWYKYGAIGKVVLNGTENWELQSINSYGIANFRITLSDYNTSSTNLALCDNFSKQDTLISNTQTEGFQLNNQKYLYIRIKSSTASTISEFKTWLSTHNTIVYYVLATPTTEITNTTLLQDLNYIKEHIKSYSSTTNISSSGNLPVIISASAIKQLS